MIEITQSMPNNNIYRLDSYTNTDWAVFKITNQGPSTLTTIVNGKETVPLIKDAVTG